MAINKNEIFLTGSTGIAGSIVIDELLKYGYSLRMMVRQFLGESQNNLLHYVQGDLIDLKNLKNISQLNAGIVHYACASLRGRADPEIDIEAMKILLSNWEQGPFTFISTLDVYGAPSTIDLIDESHELSGRMNAYAVGKTACEALIFESAKKRGRTDFTIFRAPWIFAPNSMSKKHIQERFLKCFKEEILLPGITPADWQKYIDFWVDARDLAWLVAKSLKNPLGGAGNVIGGSFNWHDFFSILKTTSAINLPIVHKSNEEIGAYAAELFGQTCIFSGEKVKNHFSFKPRYQLQETLREIFMVDTNETDFS